MGSGSDLLDQAKAMQDNKLLWRGVEDDQTALIDTEDLKQFVPVVVEFWSVAPRMSLEVDQVPTAIFCSVTPTSLASWMLK